MFVLIMWSFIPSWLLTNSRTTKLSFQFCFFTAPAYNDFFYPSTDNSKNHNGGKSNFHTTLFQNSFVLMSWPEHHNIGTTLKHNTYIFDIPVPFCHNLFLSATFKQFLTEFAGFEISFHVNYMWTPHVRSDWSNWSIKSHVWIWYALTCKQHGSDFKTCIFELLLILWGRLTLLKSYTICWYS